MAYLMNSIGHDWIFVCKKGKLASYTKIKFQEIKQPKIKNCHNENHLRGNFMYNPP